MRDDGKIKLAPDSTKDLPPVFEDISVIQEKEVPNFGTSFNYIDKVIADAVLPEYDNLALEKLADQISCEIQKIQVKNSDQLKNFIDQFLTHYVFVVDRSHIEKLDRDIETFFSLAEDFLFNELFKFIKTQQKQGIELPKETADFLFSELYTKYEQRYVTGLIHEEDFPSEIVLDTGVNPYPEVDERDAQSFENGYGDEIVILNRLIEVFGSQGTTKIIDCLLLEIKKHSTLVTGKCDVVFQKINPTYAAEKILEKLRDADSQQLQLTDAAERQYRADLARILYRLEFGNLNISARGLSYLGQTYDLGGYNNKNYFGHRLTGAGQVGIFDADKVLQKFFTADLVGPAGTKKAELIELSLAHLFNHVADEDSEERATQEEILYEFKQNYFTFLDDHFFEETGVRFNNLSLPEQAWFMRFMLQADEREQAQAWEFVRAAGEVGLRLFVGLELDGRVGTAILDLHEKIQRQNLEKVLLVYDDCVRQAEQLSRVLDEQLSISEQNVRLGLLTRAKDIVISVQRRLANGEPEATVIAETVAALRQESPAQQVKSGAFRRLAEVTRERPDNSIDVQIFLHTQESTSSENRALYLRALQERGELRPIPEIHWRVDRSLEEYQRRFGFSVPEFLASIADPTKKKLLIEFGPGSGVSKQQRAESGILDKYDDVAMADALYYPVHEYIANILDWQKIEQTLGAALPLSTEDKKLLSESLYKVIMIADDDITKDSFAYAKDRIKKLTENPASLRDLLISVAPRLSVTEQIPSTISTRDANGAVVYPYKINIASPTERSLGFLAAKTELAQNMGKYVRADIDPYEAIPAYAAGTVISDFGKISALKNNQIDVAFGVRSTVYKRDDDYINFMIAMSDKLAMEGIYIDDNIRDNDGWYYRLSELLAVMEKINLSGAAKNISFNLIVGPGFAGEDHRQDEVPLAIVMTKDADYSAHISSRLQSGYRLVDAREYISDKKNLATLDASGHVLKTVVGRESSPTSPRSKSASVFWRRAA